MYHEDGYKIVGSVLGNPLTGSVFVNFVGGKVIFVWRGVWCAVVTQGFLIYNKPTRCNSGSIVFINNYKYAQQVSDALRVHHQEHYKL